MRKERERSGLHVPMPTGSSVDASVVRHQDKTPFNKQLTTAIAEAGRGRDWDAAAAAFSQAAVKDSILCSALITAALRCGRYEDGLKVFRRMDEMGCEKTSPVYTAVVKLLARLGRYEEAKALWREFMDGLDCQSDREVSLAYHAMLDAAAQAGNVEDARRVFNELVGRGPLGLEDLTLTFGVAMNACKNARSAPFARRFLEEMDLLGVRGNEIIFTAAVAAHRWAPLQDLRALEQEYLSRGFRLNKHFVEEYVCGIMGTVLNTTGLQEALDVVGSLDGERVQALSGAIERAKQDGLPMKQMVRRVDAALRKIGVPVELLADEGVDRLGLFVSSMPPGDVVLKRVEPGGWADGKRLRRGDALLEVNGKTVASLQAAEFRAEMQARPLRMRCIRQ